MTTPPTADGQARAVAPLDRDNARAALIEACAVVGRDAADADLVRLGSNAIFRLRHDPVIVRVMRSAAQADTARREVAVARWLAAAGIPAVRVTEDQQPIVCAGRTVTFWVSAADGADYGTTKELGAILRQLHDLPPPDGLHLPEIDPFDRARSRINSARTLDQKDQNFLHERADQLACSYAELRYALPVGHIHGDANVGNTLRTRAGVAVLADLDGFAVGPREWDLIETAIYFDRFGWHSEREYQDFCTAYGFDVMGWRGYTTLADVREFLMVTWLSQNAVPTSPAEAELSRRVLTLKSGSTRRNWRPF